MYYVKMRDKFMSGWGRAAGKVNYLIVRCETFAQACAIPTARDGINKGVRETTMPEPVRQRAADLLLLRPEIGTPAWTVWHRRCVEAAQAMAKRGFEFSFMEFWKACGMPA
jgi:hypothetical protein